MKKILILAIIANSIILAGIDSNIIRFQENFENIINFSKYKNIDIKTKRFDESNWFVLEDVTRPIISIPVLESRQLQIDFLINKGSSEVTDSASSYLVRLSSIQKESKYLLSHLSIKVDLYKKQISPILRFWDQSNNLIESTPVQYNTPFRILFQYQKMPDGIIKGELFVNDKRVLPFSFFYGQNSDFSLVFPVHFPEYFNNYGGICELFTDNVVLSSEITKINLKAPEYKLKIQPGNKLLINFEDSEADSLIYYIISENKDFKFPLIKDELQLEKRKSVLIPLKAGKYYFKSSSIKKNRLNSEYTKALEIVLKDTVQNELEIINATILDEKTKKEVENLSKDIWYILEAKVSTTKNCFALFQLHHSSFDLFGPCFRPRGIQFREESNYIFNFSMGGQTVFYILDDNLVRENIRVDGKKVLYIDDSDSLFDVDPVLKKIKIRFKLLNGALSGKWMLQGFLGADNDDEISTVYQKEYYLPAEREIRSLRPRLDKIVVKRNIVAGVFLFLFLLGFSTRALSKRKNLITETLRNKFIPGEYFLPDPNSKHLYILKRIQSFVFENIQNDISVSDVAEYMEMSDVWIGKVFKDSIGMTILQFIHKTKIEIACKKLVESNMQINEIAMEVGFINIINFGRVFKKLKGQTPTEFRNNKQI